MSINIIAKERLTKIFGKQTRKILAKYDPTIIAVAGSVGKTTTKKAIATVLSEKFKVRFQDGNYNTPISIPFIFTNRKMPSLYNPFSWLMAWLQGQKVLHGKFQYDIVVIELGTDAPGDIANFRNLIHPKITVITAVAEEHMEFFKTIEAVAKEELGVAEYSEKLVINADDIKQEYLDKYLPSHKEVYLYGFKKSQYQVTTKPCERGYSISISVDDKNPITTKTVNIAEHNLKSVAAAVAVADLMRMDRGDIKKGINKITAMPGRMQILKGIKNSVIVDDSYNSSPIAVEAALKTIYNINATQKIAVLGSMNELGDYSKEAHNRVGNYCQPDKLDLVVTIGQDANTYLAPSAKNKGCRVISTDSPFEAARIVKSNLQEKALVLVKGSQNGVFSEETVKHLLANRRDIKKLVRQDSFWMNKKRAQFKDFN